MTYSTIHSEEVREDIDWSEDTIEVHSKVDLDANKPKRELNKWIWILCCAKPEAGASTAASEDGSNEHSYNIEKEIAPEELARIHAQSAKDDPKWEWAVNLGAILIIFIASFLWGYFA